MRFVFSASAVVAALACAHVATAADPVAAPPPGTARDQSRLVETACNGVDDDGDHLVDVLQPVAANECVTGKTGSCARGHFACENGRAVCYAPPPSAETYDGLDNDCNGVVDDVPAAGATASAMLHPRAVVLAPSYIWTEAATDVDDVSQFLVQAGVPFDRPIDGEQYDKTLDALDRYSLAILPGYVQDAVFSGAAKDKLRAFVERGGVLVVFKPVGSRTSAGAWSMSGLSRTVRHRDATELRFEDVRPPAFAAIDSPEERTLLLNKPGATDAVEAYALEPDPAAGTQVVARAQSASGAFPVITRRPLGKGAVYALGHDLATFGTSRCYVNCFEPTGDVLRLFFEGAFRESVAGHAVVLHSAPGAASSVFLLTHDIDAPDAYKPGPWGAPGALQMARMENARGLRGTYNITTDYVTGYFEPSTVTALCPLGMCAMGAHSVLHALDFNQYPKGTCTETRATYDGKSPTLCGEVGISSAMVADLTKRPTRVWRSPYLETSPDLFTALVARGFQFDSSFGAGDLPYNLPIDLAKVGFHQNRFQKAGLIEFPVTLEDGAALVTDPTKKRIELSAATRAEFEARWEYALRRNVDNKSFTTILVHPSRGLGTPDDNLTLKVNALAEVLDRVQYTDLMVRPMEEMGDFWRMRESTALDVIYDPKTGYSGGISGGAPAMPGLTLEFGDAVKSFSCPRCGPVTIQGKRVVLMNALPVGQRVAFSAAVH